MSGKIKICIVTILLHWLVQYFNLYVLLFLCSGRGTVVRSQGLTKTKPKLKIYLEAMIIFSRPPSAAMRAFPPPSPLNPVASPLLPPNKGILPFPVLISRFLDLPPSPCPHTPSWPSWKWSLLRSTVSTLMVISFSGWRKGADLLLSGVQLESNYRNVQN